MRLILVKLVWNFDFCSVDGGESGRMGNGGSGKKEGEGGSGRKERDWGDQKTFVLWEKEGVRVGLRVREGMR